MSYRLVVADIDGTLTTSAQQISPRVRRALRLAQRRGVRVCLASGRTWHSGRRYFQTLGADAPAILYNGGLVYDFKRDVVLYRRAMADRQARRVIKILDGFPDLAAHFYVDDEIFVRWRTPLVEANARHDHISPRAVGDFRLLLQGQPMKFRVLGPRPRLHALARRIRRSSFAGTLVFSERESLEVLPPRTSKGGALRRMARHVGISLREVMAVGNELNDLEMIRAAGLGVAMGNSPAGLRRAADVVAPTNDEDGLAEVVERYVLNSSRPAR